MEEDKKKSLVDALQDFSEVFNSVMAQEEDLSEEYWNSLTKEQQLQAFCAVVRRIHKGDIELRGSYRYVLYDVFGFGMEAYTAAQMAGYLEIHNSIYTAQELEEIKKEGEAK